MTRQAYYSVGLFGFQAEGAAVLPLTEGVSPVGLAFGFDHCSEHGEPEALAKALGVTAFADKFHSGVEAFVITDSRFIHIVRGSLRGRRGSTESVPFVALLLNYSENPTGLLDVSGANAGPREYALNRHQSDKFAKKYLQTLIPGSRHNTRFSAWSKSQAIYAMCGTHAQCKDFNTFLEGFKEPQSMTLTAGLFSDMQISGPALIPLKQIPLRTRDRWAARQAKEVKTFAWAKDLGVPELLRAAGKSETAASPRIFRDSDGTEHLFFYANPERLFGRRAWCDIEEIRAWVKGEGPMTIPSPLTFPSEVSDTLKLLHAYLRFAPVVLEASDDAPEELRVWMHFNAEGVKAGMPKSAVLPLSQVRQLVNQLGTHP